MSSPHVGRHVVNLHKTIVLKTYSCGISYRTDQILMYIKNKKVKVSIKTKLCKQNRSKVSSYKSRFLRRVPYYILFSPCHSLLMQANWPRGSNFYFNYIYIYMSKNKPYIHCYQRSEPDSFIWFSQSINGLKFNLEEVCPLGNHLSSFSHSICNLVADQH